MTQTQAKPITGMPQVPGVTQEFVAARGVPFHVARAGRGSPVVLLHGIPLHWYAWRKLIPLLEQTHELFCIDLRGCGWSASTKRGYGLADQVKDVLAVMDELGIESAKLIAHADAGWLGFALCLQAPERFTDLLALNTSHPWHPRAGLIKNAWRMWYTALWEYPVAGALVLRHWPSFTRFLLRRWAGKGYRWDPAELDAFAETARTTAYPIQQMLWQFVLNIPALARGKLAEQPLKVPARILAGNKDPVSRPVPVPGIEVEILNGGHLLAETAPRLVAAAVRG